jgi:hemoglobin
MRTALLIAALCSCACASPKSAEGSSASSEPAGAGGTAGKTLFDRLGGKPAIEAVIDDFLGRVSQDERINASFAGAHLPRLRQRLIEQVCQASGGPCTYSGRDMKTVHTGMGITGGQFDALVGHLVATLDKFKVPEKEKGELLSVLGPMRGDIVEEP